MVETRPLELPQFHDAEAEQAEKDDRDRAGLRNLGRRRVEQRLMASEDGRDWLWSLLNDCGFTNKRMAMSGGQYEQGYFDGQRETAFSLARRLAKSSPDGFAKMIIENDT
jgi:hypothetical protein